MNKRHLLPWALLLSLAVNVFLLSAFLARPDHPMPPPPRNPISMLESMAERLPPADGAILRAAIAAETQKSGQLPDDRPPGPGRLQTAMAADPFDAEKFRQEAQAMNNERLAVSEAMTRIFLDALPRMSAEGRRRVADFRPPPPPQRKEMMDRQKMPGGAGFAQ